LFLILFCLGLTLFCIRLSSANLALTVDEATTRVDLHEGQSNVSLAIQNPSAQEFAAHVRCELLDPQDKVRASIERDEWIKSGAAMLHLSLSPSFKGANQEELEKFLWYRLRYSVTPVSDGSAPVAPAEGFISLSQITPSFFELRVIASSLASSGANYTARVRATHPVLLHPVGGVSVVAKMDFETEDAAIITATGTTDADGYAALNFTLPREVRSEEAELKLFARLDDFTQEAEKDIRFDREARIMISTDKPLYQPGQMLHVRALVFNAQRRALAATRLSVTVSDQENSVVFRSALVTSRFGVANVDWQIPESLRLGDYNIEIRTEDESLSESHNSQTIKISRYDLPNFVVNIKPDKSYYLSGQDAEVEVRAGYLFGQPVARGHVRVVRETERRWNYLAQKWETTEEESFEGETDETGQFTARINLAAAHAKLRESSGEYFNDLSYAAYFTDPTTNRTEQRRFDLRVTREAIHVYVVKDNYRQANGFPTQFYLTTSYADGTPASCEVNIRNIDVEATASVKRERSQRQILFNHRPPLDRRIVTNRFGVAKVANLVLLGLKDDEDDVSLKLTARDKKGASGSLTEEFEHSPEPVIRVTTDRILYRTGEPVRAQITASKADMTVVVDVVRDWRVIRSERVNLVNGNAFLTVPYDEHFNGKVSIVAYSAQDNGINPDTLGARTVLYPSDGDLKLNVRLDRETYRPGEDARADFQVTTADGRPVESALGVVVFDRAVEERARTDSEFSANRSYGFYLSGEGGGSVAGLQLDDFLRADRKRPLPEGAALVGEVLLAHAQTYYPTAFSSAGYNHTNQSAVFENLITTQLQAVRNALEVRYVRKSEYPSSEQSLLLYLSEAGIDFKQLRDPWGTPYRPVFGWGNENDVTEFVSAGADKRFETADDFTVLQNLHPYFRPFGEKLDRVAANYHRRTHGFIRDAATLKRELRQQEGVDFDTLRDRRGKPYQLDFSLDETNFTIRVKSSDITSSYDPRGIYSPKEFTVWTNSIDYFTETRIRINKALMDNLSATGRAPRNEKEIHDLLLQSGIEPDALLDPWGHDYYFGIRSWVQNSDHLRLVHRARFGEALQPRLERRLISNQYYFVYLRSKGRDGVSNTADDFTVGAFYHSTDEPGYLKSERMMRQPQVATLLKPLAESSNGAGNLQGTIFDTNLATIAGAVVNVIDPQTGITKSTTTNQEGFYRFTGLRSGDQYIVAAAANGFAESIVEKVPIFAGMENGVDIFLEVAGLNSTVMVVGETVLIQTTQSQTSSSYTARQLTQLPFNGVIDNLALLTPGIVVTTRSGDRDFFNGVGISARGNRGRSNNFQIDGQDNNDNSVSGKISTPRLREYFPETLLWQPSLETDAEGRAQVNFKLADNITTWNLSVIGSTADGEIGVAQKEIRAFQPFFIEHEPPRVLTEGDLIELPVVLRNYLEQPQTVQLEIKPENWFTLSGASERRKTVKAGDATRAIFAFRATAPVKDGKQRITATGAGEASDAIEKPVTVHPDGEELTETKSLMMNEATTLELNFPADAIPNSTRAELKIYPGLMSHVIESIEGIMQRPYGCGEQTISSTYPSLLALSAYKRSNTSSPLKGRAERYLRLGYERLLNYHAPGGGFTYWGRGEADFALTAYALRFLSDAGEFTPVDEKILEETRLWLLKQQRADGSWHDSHGSYTTDEGAARDAMLTAHITRLLAMSAHDKAKAGVEGEAGQSAPLRLALDYLQQRARATEEPYFMASYALAAIESNEPERAAEAIGKLRAEAHAEGEESFWSSDYSTPFYGWGLAGRIETSAIAVQALKRFDEAAGVAARNSKPVETIGAIKSAHASQPPTVTLSSRGLLYLLRNKDRYGVWYSTQATINVLDALIASVPESAATNGTEAVAQEEADEAEIFVNGQRATSIVLPPDSRLSGPVFVDLSPYLAAGGNSVSISRRNAGRPALVQAVETYYVPWNSALASSTSTSEASRALRLTVSYDKTESLVGGMVTCKVRAQRVNASGRYGMMLAEIGLPPGADVDRASLEKAMSETGWSLSRYDVLPDRLVLYLWPSASGTSFEFKFRLRFGISAQTAPSMLYDYYNPEARVVVAPTKFTVR
jgi:hypothetical protein